MRATNDFLSLSEPDGIAYRQTGRTTKIINDAIEEALKNKNQVYIVFPTVIMAIYAVHIGARLLIDKGFDPTGTSRCLVFKDQTIAFITVNNPNLIYDERTKKIIVRGAYGKVFLDHTVKLTFL